MIIMAEERIARALRHLSEDAGLLSTTDSVLKLIEDYATTSQVTYRYFVTSPYEY